MSGVAIRPLPPRPRPTVQDRGSSELFWLQLGVLHMCRDTVYRLCDRGELPHVRVANAIRIATADLAAFLAGQRIGPLRSGRNEAGNDPGGALGRVLGAGHGS